MKKLLFLPVLLLIIISCNKKYTSVVNVDNTIDTNTNSNYPKVYIKDSLKSLYFLKGSYWVYQNDSLHQNDCTVISKVHHWFQNYQFHYMHWAQEYYLMSFTPYPQTNHSVFVHLIETTHMYLNPEMMNFEALGPVLYSIDTISDWNQYTPHKFIDSLLVGTKVFYKVQECSVADTDYYTVAKYGVIRKTIHATSGSQTWNLIRWMIRN